MRASQTPVQLGQHGGGQRGTRYGHGLPGTLSLGRSKQAWYIASVSIESGLGVQLHKGCRIATEL
eukprot:jgi/Picsp_1/84/NSC_00084-R1_---NA---